jgi:hypothetical protein
MVLFSLAGAAQAQPALESGAPAAAFAGGPIHLSPAAIVRLRAQYHGDKVPLVPQPYRGRLDAALVANDWRRVAALKADLAAARGPAAALFWEQSRFTATGAIGVAELHARDLAALDAPQAAEPAVTLWLYAAAASLTDGRLCADPDAGDRALDALRGPDYAGVLQRLRALPPDRLGPLRDAAIRMEGALAGERSDDALCRVNGRLAVRPEADSGPLVAETRRMLPRHLAALTSVLRQAAR